MFKPARHLSRQADLIWTVIRMLMRLKTKALRLDVVTRTSHWPTVAAAAVTWDALAQSELLGGAVLTWLAHGGADPVGEEPDRPSAATGFKQSNSSHRWQGTSARKATGLLPND